MTPEIRREAYAPLWIPLCGLIYALRCPVSEKYYHPFARLTHRLVWDGPVAQFLSPNGIAAGALLLRGLLLVPFVAALAVRTPQVRQVRWYAVAAGMYWPLIIPSIIIVSNSSYGIIVAWMIVPIHIGVAIAATVAANHQAKHLGRWVWLGVLAGFSLFWLSRGL